MFLLRQVLLEPFKGVLGRLQHVFRPIVLEWARRPARAMVRGLTTGRVVTSLTNVVLLVLLMDLLVWWLVWLIVTKVNRFCLPAVAYV